jgi:hypothetical protein
LCFTLLYSVTFAEMSRQFITFVINLHLLVLRNYSWGHLSLGFYPSSGVRERPRLVELDVLVLLRGVRGPGDGL